MNNLTLSKAATWLLYALSMLVCLYLASSVLRVSTLIANDKAQAQAEFEQVLPIRQAIEFAKKYVLLLQARDTESLQRYASTTVNADDINKIIASGMLPTATAQAINVVAVDIAGVQKAVTLEYVFPAEPLLIKLTYYGARQSEKIYGVQIDQLPMPLEVMNKVSLTEASNKQYGALAFYYLLLAFEMVMLSLCVFSKHIRDKKIWMIVVVIGGGLNIYFNWTQQLYGVSGWLGPLYWVTFDYSVYAPMTLRYSIPIGGLLLAAYWWRKRRMPVLENEPEVTPRPVGEDQQASDKQRPWMM